MGGHTMGRRDPSSGQRALQRSSVVGCALLLLLAFGVLAGCSQRAANVVSSPTLAFGWTWYHDSLYTFQFAIPPNWKAIPYLNTNTDVGDCEEVAYLLPPTASAPSDLALIAQYPEYLSVSIRLNCGPLLIEEAGGNAWHAEVNTIIVDGATTRIYDRTTPGGAIERLIAQTYGGYQFLFYLRAPTAQMAQDLTLYLQMLRSFHYEIPTPVPGS